MSNIAGKAYAMNVLTPMKPWRSWANRLIFMVGRIVPSVLRGLMGLSLIHFARWVIIKRDQWPMPGRTVGRPVLQNDYMLFCSNFNGSWDQYIDAFSDGIPSGLDLFWYSSTGYPGSIPISRFKTYITHNQIDTDYYYNATPGSAQRDIKAAMRVHDALRQLQAQHSDPKQSAEDFQKAFIDMLAKVQGNLGEPGYAPIASLDTERADSNRRDFIEAAWAGPERPVPLKRSA